MTDTMTDSLSEIMTDQQIFDKVVTHLFNQGHQASVIVDGTPACKYRMTNGDMCAAGCLIPDELYMSSMEGFPIDHLIKGYKLPSYFTSYAGLIKRLQIVHDIYFDSLEQLRQELTYVAHSFGLSTELLESL